MNSFLGRLWARTNHLCSEVITKRKKNQGSERMVKILMVRSFFGGVSWPSWAVLRDLWKGTSSPNQKEIVGEMLGAT